MGSAPGARWDYSNIGWQVMGQILMKLDGGDYGEIIRRRIGFSGLLLTDDLDMEALEGSVPERAERALAAGCDIALNCWAKLDDMTGICQRLPALDEKAAARLARTLSFTRLDDVQADQAERLAKRDALLALAGEAA